MKWNLLHIGWGFFHRLSDEKDQEIWSAEASQMLVIADIFRQPEDVQKAILKRAKEMAEYNGDYLADKYLERDEPA
jgi:hypothetical protein